MPEINWVGFRKSPKLDPSLTVARVGFSLSCSKSPAEVFSAFSDAQKVSLWLAPVKKLDFRNGGSITFADSELNEKGEPHTAAFSNIQVGRRVVLVSDVYGEIDSIFAEKHESISISVTFAKAISSADEERFRALCDAVFERLSEQLGASHG